MKVLLFYLFIPCTLFAATINIINDSSYQLEARIYSPTREVVGSAMIPPNGQSYYWKDSQHGASDWIEGPFTVRFYCLNGDEYGRIYRVADGVTVRAKGSIGPRRCFSRPKALSPSPESQQKEQIPEYPDS